LCQPMVGEAGGRAGGGGDFFNKNKVGNETRKEERQLNENINFWAGF